MKHLLPDQPVPEKCVDQNDLNHVEDVTLKPWVGRNSYCSWHHEQSPLTSKDYIRTAYQQQQHQCLSNVDHRKGQVAE